MQIAVRRSGFVARQHPHLPTSLLTNATMGYEATSPKTTSAFHRSSTSIFYLHLSCEIFSLIISSCRTVLVVTSTSHIEERTFPTEQITSSIMHRTYSMRQSRAPTASQLQNPPPPSSTTKSGRFFGKAGLGKLIGSFCL